LSYTFNLETAGDFESIHIGLKDGDGGYTEFGQRGTGLQKVVTLLGQLAAENIGAFPSVILLDEPENSLHADAQHALRRFLEILAETENIQVVYSTHSPAMINPLRPETVRLLKQEQAVDGNPTTKYYNKSVWNDFGQVRSSLGLTLGDSLMYGPISVLVEGATEVRCLPKLLLKLSRAQKPGFEDVEHLLSHCTFVGVGGDSFASQCTLSRSLGLTPIVYSDGDITKRVQDSLRKDHSGVVVVAPADALHEAEHLVPSARYFSAVAAQKDDPAICAAAFETWMASGKAGKVRMFSKQVEYWLSSEYGFDLCKPLALAQACDDCDVEEIATTSLKELAAAIREALVSI
jgi:ABC-type phosphate/phosphonate transport system ATPase subunit